MSADLALRAAVCGGFRASLGCEGKGRLAEKRVGNHEFHEGHEWGRGGERDFLGLGDGLGVGWALVGA